MNQQVKGYKVHKVYKVKNLATSRLCGEKIVEIIKKNDKILKLLYNKL